MTILIIGKNSYIGNHIDEWLTKYGHQATQLDVLTEDWKNYDYSAYDSIVHVAGIVHRPSCNDWKLYHDVNTIMPISIAKRYNSARSSKGLSAQYLYFSTMGVYNAKKSLDGFVVDSNTPMLKDGNSMYGKSKFLAEVGLAELQDDNFDVAFIRPPSVYGKGCKGGYITGFATIANQLPIIPQAYERATQSFVYIDNLCECVRLIVENHLRGGFCPQDDEIPNANRLFEVICNGIGKPYRSSKLLGLCLRMVSFIPIVNKAYGGVSYSRELSTIPGLDYVVVPFEEGMRRTVNGK